MIPGSDLFLVRDHVRDLVPDLFHGHSQEKLEVLLLFLLLLLLQAQEQDRPSPYVGQQRKAGSAQTDTSFWLVSGPSEELAAEILMGSCSSREKSSELDCQPTALPPQCLEMSC
jgi:hypothetical protein